MNDKTSSMICLCKYVLPIEVLPSLSMIRSGLGTTNPSGSSSHSVKSRA